jgi:MFS family permease
MTIERRPAVAAKAHNTLNELREGWNYVSRFPPIRNVLLLLALVSLVGVPYSVLMPIFADRLRPNDPHVLGWLMAASGVGALVGALSLAARRSVLGLGRVIPMASGAFGLGLIGFSLCHVLWLSLLLMVVTGFGFMMQMASSNTLLQTIVEDDKRGRVMSFYTMAFMGTAPFGSLLAGGLAERIGAPHTLLYGGLGCLVGALGFAKGLPGLRAAIRPIYRQLGILPELVSGINQASELARPPED